MRHQGTVAYHTLGCKLNFAETSTIARNLENEGFGKVSFDETADIYVINTCSVTEQANKKCRNMVRKAMGRNPEAFVVVIGCYAQLKPTEIAEIDGVDLVLGANEKFNVSNYLDNLEKKKETMVMNNIIKETKEFVPSWSAGDRTRSFLKVQDGCDYFCSFCTIPLARGRSRSADIASVLENAREIAAKGVKEVVLTGVNIGDFRNEQGETFFDLIKALDNVEGIERFRISSIEPNLLSDEIIEFVAQSQRFAPHFHIPLQSGSDRLLESMRRRYMSSLYADRVQNIKKLMPDCCIGVDVIVGYPGETDEEFQKTYDFINNLDVSYLHVFTYSERLNTTAVRMDGVVPVHIRQERNKKLRILSLKKQRAFYQSQIAKESVVLFEEAEHDGKMQGFTSNYVKVIKPYSADDVNQLVAVSLKDINTDGHFDFESVIQMPVR